jgi:hypothetical protein
MAHLAREADVVQVHALTHDILDGLRDRRSVGSRVYRRVSHLRDFNGSFRQRDAVKM